MLHLFVQISKYLMIMLFLIYTFDCFFVFRFEHSPKKQRHIYHRQKVILYLLHFNAYLVLYLQSRNPKLIGFYLAQVVLISVIFAVYHFCYQKASDLLLNNMCMLLCIGFIMITRISFDKAVRQFAILCASTIIALLIPLILQKSSNLRKGTWLYAITGIAALAAVLVAGAVSYGAKLSISIAGISIQPSEFVKILYVFFLASLLEKRSDFLQVLLAGIFAAMHVLILIFSKDLGGAFLFFFTFVMIVYVASQKAVYLICGSGALIAAGLLSYRLFSHVQNRVVAWLDPVSVIDTAGYQISQSLFAIGTGSWFGLGLGQGMPGKIPIVEKDFIFSAISEEMGGVFAICLIMVCVSCFFMFMNVAMKLKDQFYKLTALGLGSLYALQVFLTIGGVTKFIPSTGVTLPLVSYGGSSLLSTMILFGVIQGLYIRQEQTLDTPLQKPKKRDGTKERSAHGI